MINVIGIFIGDRQKEALEVQRILTRYGCNIKTRIGLHEVNEAYCSSGGLILLELTGDLKEQENLITSLEAVHNIQVKKMVFEG
ncbi:MAG: hypothetical protein PHU97_01925 [Bacteroidales bacterium]|nr:hypothetical protein [Bacteroidales bacterium]MDD2322181.1 hypothetical protein [Bacteroidales bacterium]MDD3010058.1 hypothetical protein [Bacteroidales bacterium]MDD3960889.1 hypothetical protein [Bacteroidales bacterium]MDY0285251.1 hypothetical protein [Bacteroidales bacterium]